MKKRIDPKNKWMQENTETLKENSFFKNPIEKRNILKMKYKKIQSPMEILLGLFPPIVLAIEKRKISGRRKARNGFTL